MREKKRCRWLALLLAVVMVLSVLPTAVFAGEESGNTFYRIFHLDCGRKYFSVEQIKALIDTLAANHYTHIELAVGNDGLRFLLDDMSVTANGTTYSSENVKDGIQAGNTAYYNDPNGNALTETEMNTIIAYAASKNIEIIPLVNTPGHMDAILYACKQLCDSSAAYGSSSTTIDVKNEKAVAFTQALVQKYVTYFANKGCKFFNIGADEYAGTSFGELQSAGSYDKYANYVNGVAAIIKKANMTPMAFNDGIYYNGANYAGNSEITFDTDIVICYWTYGYGGYYPASVAYLQSKGFESFIHTNESWYYVLGLNDSSWAGYNTAENATKTIAVDSMSVDEIGAMLCVWCDTPSASYDNNATRVSTLISNLANNNPTYFVADSGETDPTDPGEGTENKTITVTVGRTATDTISGYNFAGTYTTENPSIATVKVTGTDAVEATTTYTQASVTCYGLLPNDSEVWTAVSDYYYKADDGNYYPVYAKRSSSLGGYTYTWGYSKTSSTNDVTQIGNTQSTYRPWRTAPNITVYTKSGTDGTPASTTVTFNGVAVGTTYVTVGNTRYTINVVAEDLSTVTPLTVEYWITNLPVTADGATSKKISAQSAYGEAGVDVSTLVPATGTYEYGSVVYWKGTVLDASNKQTTAGGVENDKTGSGKDFHLIRYYNGSWQYFYEADGAWNTISSTDQVVIYWLQPTEVTKEITTLVKDWGFAPDAQGDNEKKVALTVAVVYPDGTVSPAEGDMYSTSTTLFNYWQGRDIGLVAPVNNSDYKIAKITVTDGTRDQSGTGMWGTNDTITWEKVTNEAGQQWYNETTYWDETVGGTPMVNGATSNITWSNYNTAKLVLIYLKPVHYDTNLIVNWVDDSDSGALISTMEVAVSSDGTPITFYNGLKQTSALPTEGVGGTFTLDDNAYVTNSSNVNQTFNKNISTVPDVAEQYKSGLYSYVSADLSADGKTLTLHYNIDASKLSKTFVVDFGLPISIPLSEFLKNPDEASVTLENNCVSPVGAGDANYDEINSSIVFTPSAVLNDAVAISVKVTYTGNRQETLRIGILPASNVLYEDNFLTEDTTHSYASWHKEGTAASVPQSVDQGALYGYDVAYVPEAGSVAPSNSMGSAWTIAGLSSGNGSQYLTTTFTGNGFDLIGTAGPDTGYVYVLLKPKDGSTAKLYVVDTSYVDGSNTTLTQVPLLHAEFDTQRTYDVTIRAAYRQATAAADSGATVTQTSRAAAFSMSAAPTSLDSVYDVVDSFFADGFEIDDVEYVYFDDASALAELENSSRATYAMSYALNSATAAATADAGVNATTARPAGDTVTIDGFRVYRSTDNSAYSVSDHNEYEATYVNVAEAVLNGTFTAFTENGSSDWTSVKDYHDAGGPKWEVYLDLSSAIAFKVDTTKPVQISARALGDSAVMKVNGTDITLTSKTEMYYEVTPNGGIVTIRATSGELAIANIKMPGGAQTTALTEDEITNVVPMLLRMAAAPVEPDPEQPGTEEPEPTPVFTPETFKTRVNSIRTRNRKIVTLTITASTDVDHVVVNGKTYYPMNKLLVKWGLSKTYVFTIMDTAGASETRSFEIVAYNADGLASSTYTDAG